MGAEMPKPQKPGRKSGRVLTSLFWGTILLALVASGAAFRHYARKVKEQAREAWGARLSALADDRKRAIERWLEGAQADARVVLSFPTVRLLLEKKEPPPGERPYPEKVGAAGHLEEVVSGFAEAKGYVGMVLLDPSGRTLAVAPAAFSPPEGCRRGMGGLTWKDAGARFFQTPEGRPLVVHARPAGPPGEGGSTAVLLLVNDASAWLYPLLTLRPSVTETGEVFLLRREGELVRYLTPLRFSRLPPLSFTAPYHQAALAGRWALEGRRTFGKFLDYRGDPSWPSRERSARPNGGSWPRWTLRRPWRLRSATWLGSLPWESS